MHNHCTVISLKEYIMQIPECCLIDMISQSEGRDLHNSGLVWVFFTTTLSTLMAAIISLL